MWRAVIGVGTGGEGGGVEGVGTACRDASAFKSSGVGGDGMGDRVVIGKADFGALLNGDGGGGERKALDGCSGLD